MVFAIPYPYKRDADRKLSSPFDTGLDSFYRTRWVIQRYGGKALRDCHSPRLAIDQGKEWLQ